MDKQKRKKLKTAAKGYAFIGINLIGVLIFWTVARIWYVTIPMLSGTTFFIVITSVINSFKVFGLINLMTHGGPGTATTMLVYNIYRTAFQFGKLEFASAQGIVLLAIIFFITWLQFRIQKRNEE